MKVSFFPGCSLEGTAREYGESIDAVCKSLDVELEELAGWSCCGASSAHCMNEYLSIALPARNLALAERTGHELITPCAGCFNRLKAAEKALAGEGRQDMGSALHNSLNIRHILDFFTGDDFAQSIDQHISRPLTGLKTVSYYGCLLVRPPKITDARHWEDPRSLDELMSRLGAENLFWPYKTDCCGGSLVLSNVSIIRRLTGKLLDMARDVQADCIVTACPLCQANLDTRQEEIGDEKGLRYDLPIFYFTELMGISFGNKAAGTWLRRHLIDPRPLLKRKGLL